MDETKAPTIPGYYIRIRVEDEKGARWGYLRFPGGPLAGERIVFPDGDSAVTQLPAAREFFGEARLEPADRPANLITCS